MSPSIKKILTWSVPSIVTFIALLFLISSCRAPSSETNLPNSPEEVQRKNVVSLGSHELTIDKELSKAIVLPYGMEFHPQTIDKDIPFEVWYNGGEGHGGWTHRYIPQQEWAEKHFTLPGFTKGKVRTIQFKLGNNAPRETGVVGYRIEVENSH